MKTVAVATPIDLIADALGAGLSDTFDIATSPNSTPHGPLNLKPGTTPLAPSRAPAPMAIVGGGSLRVNADAPPSRPGPNRTPPSTNDVGFAPAAPPAPISPRGLNPSLGPSASSSRPNTPRPFTEAAGGPPASYERAFRQWSSPSLPPADDPSGAHGPVTFQVYTPQDISRAPRRSMVSIAQPPKKGSPAVRIGLALVGLLVVLLTAAAVIAVSTEEPRRPTAATTRATATTPVPVPTEMATPDPVPSTISIGDPVTDDVLPVTVSSSKPKPKPVNPPAQVAPMKVPAPTSTTPAAPASLKGLAPPPNPYGK